VEINLGFSGARRTGKLLDLLEELVPEYLVTCHPADGPLEPFLTQPRPRRSHPPSCNAALFPTVNDAMPDSTSMTRGSQTIEMGGVRMDDEAEAELTRMGYKQELKYVQVNFMLPFLRKL
jgi:hypothetical protein